MHERLGRRRQVGGVIDPNVLAYFLRPGHPLVLHFHIRPAGARLRQRIGERRRGTEVYVFGRVDGRPRGHQDTEGLARGGEPEVSRLDLTVDGGEILRRPDLVDGATDPAH